MKRTLITVTFSALALLVLACSSSASGTSSGGNRDDTDGLPPADSGGLAAGGGGLGAGAAIDWINFIHFDGVTYLANSHSIDQRNPALPRDILGPKHDEVRFMVAGNVADPNYQLKDGDAAFWQKGTPVYEVKGYDPKTLLAAVNDSGRVIVFEADSNDDAKKGSDLLDLEGKVRSFRLLSTEDATTELATLLSADADSLVEAILEAPVDQSNPAYGELAAFVEFQLADGIVIVRAYFDTGELSRGIRLSEAAQQIIESAIAAR